MKKLLLILSALLPLVPCCHCFPLVKPTVSPLLYPMRSPNHVRIPVQYSLVQRGQSRSFSKSSRSRLSVGNKDPDDDFDPRVITADLLSLALASQLLGLLDVLDNPQFWQNGGWFQPVTIESTSTLPQLVQRFSTMSSLYLAAAWLTNGGYHPPSPEKTSSSSETLKPILVVTLKSTVVFAVLRSILALVIALTTQQDVAITETLRETYFVGLAICASRYLTYTLFYR